MHNAKRTIDEILARAKTRAGIVSDADMRRLHDLCIEIAAAIATSERQLDGEFGVEWSPSQEVIDYLQAAKALQSRIKRITVWDS